MHTDSNDTLDAMAALFRAADADPGLRKRLRFLIQLPSFQRASIVNTSVEEMALRGEPEDVRTAFRLLATDEAAKIALRYLSRYDKPG
jgi:hypothetical protein